MSFFTSMMPKSRRSTSSLSSGTSTASCSSAGTAASTGSSDSNKSSSSVFSAFKSMLPSSSNNTSLSKGQLDEDDAERMLKKIMNYKKVSKLGSGHYGTVFSVESTELKYRLQFACKVSLFGSDWLTANGKEEDVALKNRQKAFETEVKMLDEIKHENIVKMVSSWQLYGYKGNVKKVFGLHGHGELVYPSKTHALLMTGIVMEHMFLNLAEFMEMKKWLVLGEDQMSNLFMQIGCALVYLHGEMHICHEDLKACNIAVVRPLGPGQELPLLKLMDFGRAKKYPKREFDRSERISEAYNPSNAGKQVAVNLLLSGLDSFEDSVKINPFMMEAYNFGKMLVQLATPFGLHRFQCAALKKVINTMAAQDVKIPQVNVSWALSKYLYESSKPEEKKNATAAARADNDKQAPLIDFN